MNNGLTQGELESLLIEFACEDIGELQERMNEYHQLCIMKAKIDKLLDSKQLVLAGERMGFTHVSEKELRDILNSTVHSDGFGGKK